MITAKFIADFKEKTEARWRNRELDPDIHGFQIQKGTRWNPGLSEGGIKRYEHDLGFAFPVDLRLFLAYLNGTDRTCPAGTTAGPAQHHPCCPAPGGH